MDVSECCDGVGEEHYAKTGKRCVKAFRFEWIDFRVSVCKTRIRQAPSVSPHHIQRRWKHVDTNNLTARLNGVGKCERRAADTKPYIEHSLAGTETKLSDGRAPKRLKLTL